MEKYEKLALVTGGNRGLGFETCRQLGRLDYKVILSARNEQSGVEKARKLQDEGLDVVFCRLDLADFKSIKAAIQLIVNQYGVPDVLVNNGGVLLDTAISPSLNILRDTMEINVYGPYLLCQLIAPMMKIKSFGRIVNVSSHMGSLAHMEGDYPAYRISKTALNAVTRTSASQFNECNVLINSVCPGWVKTDMGGPNAPRSISEGVDTIIWAATLPDDGPTGGFFQDRKQIDW